MKSGFDKTNIKKCLSTPFDNKFTYHSQLLRRPQIGVLKHLRFDNNIVLITLRQTRGIDKGCYFITDSIFSKGAISMLDKATGFPLYLYPKTTQQTDLNHSAERTPNLNFGIVQ